MTAKMLLVLAELVKGATLCPMKLYLLRHGETDWNVTWRLQGSTDVPLNETGIAQAQDAAIRYKDIPFTQVYTSPLQRAVCTARIIAESHGLPVIVDERIREMNFGLLEGSTPEESSQNPVLSVARSNLFDHPERYVPTGDGESYEEVHNRCRDFLEDIRNRHDSGDHILISAHGALCKALMRAINNTPVEEFWHTPPQENCSVIEIDW